MVRHLRFVLAFGLALLIAACGEGPSGAFDPLAVKSGIDPVQVTDCTANVGTLLDEAAAIFGAGSPNYNSVRGKIENLAKQIEDGNTAAAEAKAFDIVDFVLLQEKEKDLAGTEEQVATFANNIYCFAGLSITVSDPSNTHLIYPTDSAQIVYDETAQAGILFQAFPVNTPTLITFDSTGTSNLQTKLDKYQGFFSITAQGAVPVQLTAPATVGICADGAIPAEVRDRLRLGHGLDADDDNTYEGFEITPEADASFLQCENLTDVAQSSIVGRLWRTVAKAVMPKAAYARTFRFAGGGVGGTVTEFSPFAPVDPVLEFGGGVGGTVTEFIRISPTKTSVLGEASLASTCEAPIGSPVKAECQPYIHLKTRLGTDFANVPVSWDVTAGAGAIADLSPADVCSTFGTTVSDLTSIAGKSGVCWNLGTEGTNTVTATPSLGGDAEFEGIIFMPATQTFTATANPPSALAFLNEPTSTVVGTNLEARVEVRDKNGDRVIGYNGPVSIGIASGPTGGALVGTTTVDAASGVARFNAFTITKAGSYTLNASAPFLPGPANLPVTASFTMSPDAPILMTIVQGNGGTFAAGSVTTPAPTVLVVDRFSNPISGAAVDWTTALSTEATVSPARSNTASNGWASTVWTLGDGANQLRAELASNPAIFVVFEATGTSTFVNLNVCAPAGAKDPVNGQYGFYIPDPGAGKTIRSIAVYFSSQGKANLPTEYEIELSTQRGTFNPAESAPVRSKLDVNLRGNNSEDKLATFTLTQPIVGAGGGAPIMVRLNVTKNPDGAVITFNAGQCTPGSKNCKVPTGCNVTEVSAPTPYPTGTFYRKTVGLIVRGTTR